MERNCKLIMALDTDNKKEFIRWVDATRDKVEYYKVGLISFTALGNETISILKKRKKKIFLDLKFYDIPNTMFRAAVSACKQGVDILDFHLAAEKQGLQTVVRALKQEAKTK